MWLDYFNNNAKMLNLNSIHSVKWKQYFFVGSYAKTLSNIQVTTEILNYFFISALFNEYNDLKNKLFYI